jgi:hypothetical protein
MYRNNDSLSFGGAGRAKEIIAAVLDAKKSGLVQAAFEEVDCSSGTCVDPCAFTPISSLISV